MQLLVHCHVVPKLVSDRLILRPLEVPGLTSVENLAEHIVVFGLTWERQRLAKAASDNLAEQLILQAIVKEHRASLNIEQVGKHLYQAWQVELERVVERNVPRDKEQAKRVLNCLSCLQEEVVLGLPRAKYLGHSGDHAFSHEV